MFLPDKQMKLKELTIKLGFTDNRTTLNWLRGHNIEPVKMGREYVIFQWDVDLAIQLNMVEGLKKRFPSTWAEIYKAGTKDEYMVKSVFKIHPPKDLSIMKVSTKGNTKFF